MTRREMLARVAKTSVAAAATVGLGTWLVNREVNPRALLTPLRDHRIAVPWTGPDLAISRGGDVVEGLRRALRAVGGIERFVRPGERVVIKPNVGWNRLPEQAANTNPDLVEELVQQVKGAGAAEIWVTDVSVNDPERCFARSGVREAAERAGARVILPNAAGFRPVLVGGVLLREADVLWPFVEADRVINVPIVKQHGLSGVTLSMKNWYGVLGGHRVRLHQDIHQSVVDLAGMMKPTLTVLDATRVLVANGPTGGNLDDVKRLDTVAVGTDEVALDALGAELLGRAPGELAFLGLAQAAGLGRIDYRSLRVAEVRG
ncbi:MAG: DUF362 domain-containing protein [Myxococcota bacterium]